VEERTTEVPVGNGQARSVRRGHGQEAEKEAEIMKEIIVGILAVILLVCVPVLLVYLKCDNKYEPDEKDYLDGIYWNTWKDR
jgi:hypothetical protein